jgi:UDP-glucose 4-epimerase
VYGEPERVPIAEDGRKWPRNPYGWSKLILEQVLDAYDTAYGLKYVALRYFNAAGATEKCGEVHDPESHLIPNVLAAAAGDKRELSVFGDKYATPDGTAIRDYIHVAHSCIGASAPRGRFRCAESGNGAGALGARSD